MADHLRPSYSPALHRRLPRKRIWENRELSIALPILYSSPLSSLASRNTRPSHFKRRKCTGDSHSGSGVIAAARVTRRWRHARFYQSDEGWRITRDKFSKSQQQRVRDGQRVFDPPRGNFEIVARRARVDRWGGGVPVSQKNPPSAGGERGEGDSRSRDARNLGYKTPRLARQFEFEGRVWREIAPRRFDAACGVMRRGPRHRQLVRSVPAASVDDAERRENRQIRASEYRAGVRARAQRDDDNEKRNPRYDELGKRGSRGTTYPAGPRWESLHLRPESQKKKIRGRIRLRLAHRIRDSRHRRALPQIRTILDHPVWILLTSRGRRPSTYSCERQRATDLRAKRRLCTATWAQLLPLRAVSISAAPSPPHASPTG